MCVLQERKKRTSFLLSFSYNINININMAVQKFGLDLGQNLKNNFTDDKRRIYGTQTRQNQKPLFLLSSMDRVFGQSIWTEYLDSLFGQRK